jgi:hypothetical protein
MLQNLGFSEGCLTKMAIDSGFIKRVRKLNGLDYIMVLLLNVSNEMVSYNTMASTLLGQMEKSVFKQSLHKAMRKDSFLVFVENVFKKLMETKIGLSTNKLKSKFKRIIIQDSTIIRLPTGLFTFFSGVKNKTKQCANARIQVALDILPNVFTCFSIDSYSINDMAAAHKLPIQKGDLIIRDRGYCSFSEIKRVLSQL